MWMVSAPAQVLCMKPLAVINFKTCLRWVQVANRAEWGFCRARKQPVFKNFKYIKLMKLHHKWIKETLLRVFVTEQVVPPGPYWHLTASPISAGIKHELKRDFAT